jgi:Cft2 family RNA processing exonuclease
LKPETRNPNPETRNPKPETRNPKPETRNPKPETRNLVIILGDCVAGTLGHKVLSNGGKPQTINLPADEGGGQLHVRCKIRHLSFSAHADAKGIMTLIKQVQPSTPTPNP